MTQNSKIVLDGEIAVLIQAFISTEETRYYLNGFFVEADATGGIRVVATDGHRLGMFHDPLGSIEGPTKIVQLPKAAIALLKKKPSRSYSTGWVIVIENDTARIHKALNTPENMATLAHYYDSRDEGVTFTNVYIDGTFPDYRRVIPDMPEKRPNEIVGFNPKYLGDFHAACDGGMTFLSGFSEGPILVVGNRLNFLGVLMPMRVKNTKLPAFWATELAARAEPKEKTPVAAE